MIKKKALLTLFVIAAAASHCFAQTDPTTGPCDFTDIDNPCPLDTWVIVLAIAALAFTAMHLHRKQKSLQA